MVRGELRSVVAGAPGPEQRGGPRVMEVCVMEDRQPRISKEIGPEIVVMR